MSSVCVNKRRACVFALILVCMCQQHGAQTLLLRVHYQWLILGGFLLGIGARVHDTKIFFVSKQIYLNFWFAKLFIFHI